MFIKKTLIALTRFYQIVISPILGQNKCRFEPSCSSYFITAVKKKGVVKGIFLGIWRILRCNPYSKGGSDPVK